MTLSGNNMIIKRKKYVADSVSITGYSHLINNKECQDSSFSYNSGKIIINIVSDGHGGDKYFRSSMGSKFACEVGNKCIFDFSNALLKDHKLFNEFKEKKHKSDEMLSQLEKSIIHSWIEKVFDHFNKNPFIEDRFNMLTDGEKKNLLDNPIKAYGATFVSCFKINNLIIVMKIGDGNVCVLNEKNEIFMIEEIVSEMSDDMLAFNLTTSLCDSNPDIEFKHCVLDEKCKNKGILITSDGVVNSYKDYQSYKAFIKNIFLGYMEDELEKAHEDLKNFLPKISEKGSGDDLSVSLFVER